MQRRLDLDEMEQEDLEEMVLRQDHEELALLFATFSRQLALEELATRGPIAEHLFRLFEVVLAAVCQYGLAVQHASQDLLADKDIALAAFQQDGSAPEFLSAFQSDLEVVLEAVKNDHYAVLWASPVLQTHRIFALRAVRANELTLGLVSVEFGYIRKELHLAAASHLAAAGEFAPVLTIDSMHLICTPPHADHEGLRTKTYPPTDLWPGGVGG